MSTPEQAVWFSQCVQPHEPALRAFLSRRFGSLPDHDDLVQEAYVRLLRNPDQERLVHARSYLFTTARNLAIDHIRRAHRTPVDPIDETAEISLLETAPSAAELVDYAQRNEVMFASLKSLPERCREVMLLRYVDGFTPQEIAEHLGLAAATVRVHLMKGVRDCAAFFRERGLLDLPDSARKAS
jgi:RNA polymerase sigma factor (sigma-70 family)